MPLAAEVLLGESAESRQKGYSYVLDSIHWFAHGTDLVDLSDRILNFTTSIECVFVQKDRSITATVADGLAFIFADAVEERLVLRKEVIRLYGLRSAISHGGAKKILQSDVDSLRGLAADLILFLLGHQKHFPTRETFNTWLDSVRLGLSNDPNMQMLANQC